MTKRRRGRPSRVEGERATERVSALLTPQERAALREIAKTNGLTVGQILRDAVNEYVADYGERHVFS